MEGIRRLVEALYEAFAERDLDAVLDLIATDFEFRPAVTPDLTQRTVYEGHQGMRDYFEDVSRVWSELRLIPQRFVPAGDALLVLGRVYARTAEGALVDSPAGWIWEARAGKLSRCVVYRSHPEAIDAAGTIEPDAHAARVE